jgi:hypothetical protein
MRELHQDRPRFAEEAVMPIKFSCVHPGNILYAVREPHPPKRPARIVRRIEVLTIDHEKHEATVSVDGGPPMWRGAAHVETYRRRRPKETS